METEEAGAQTVGRISPPVAVRESSRAAIAPPCTKTCQICDFVVLVFLCTPPSNSPTDSHFSPPPSDSPGISHESRPKQHGAETAIAPPWYHAPCTKTFVVLVEHSHHLFPQHHHLTVEENHIVLHQSKHGQPNGTTKSPGASVLSSMSQTLLYWFIMEITFLEHCLTRTVMNNQNNTGDKTRNKKPHTDSFRS